MALWCGCGAASLVQVRASEATRHNKAAWTSSTPIPISTIVCFNRETETTLTRNCGGFPGSRPRTTKVGIRSRNPRLPSVSRAWAWSLCRTSWDVQSVTLERNSAGKICLNATWVLRGVPPDLIGRLSTLAHKMHGGSVPEIKLISREQLGSVGSVGLTHASQTELRLPSAKTRHGGFGLGARASFPLH